MDPTIDSDAPEPVEVGTAKLNNKVDMLTPSLQEPGLEKENTDTPSAKRAAKDRTNNTETHQGSTHSIDEVDEQNRPKSKPAAKSGTSNRHKKHLMILQHACRCTDRRCTLPECPKMKKLLQHILRCTVAHCKVCRPLDMLLFIHSRTCTEKSGDCVVPKCVPRRKIETMTSGESHERHRHNYSPLESFEERRKVRRVSGKELDFFAMPYGPPPGHWPPPQHLVHPPVGYPFFNPGSAPRPRIFGDEYQQLLNPGINRFRNASPTSDQIFHAWSRSMANEYSLRDER